MSTNLVIVESPGKVKSIKKYLGKDFEVLASYGHVRDLVPKEGAVDPSHHFAMKYQIVERNQKHIDAISRAQVTFRYGANGPEGLLTGKTVYVALTRGGQYRNTPADTQVPYLKMVFSFLGMTDVKFVYAEGLAMGPEAVEKALTAAHVQIDEAVAA